MTIAWNRNCVLSNFVLLCPYQYLIKVIEVVLLGQILDTEVVSSYQPNNKNKCVNLSSLSHTHILRTATSPSRPHLRCELILATTQPLFVLASPSSSLLPYLTSTTQTYTVLDHHLLSHWRWLPPHNIQDLCFWDGVRRNNVARRELWWQHRVLQGENFGGRDGDNAVADNARKRTWVRVWRSESVE